MEAKNPPVLCFDCQNPSPTGLCDECEARRFEIDDCREECDPHEMAVSFASYPCCWWVYHAEDADCLWCHEGSYYLAHGSEGVPGEATEGTITDLYALYALCATNISSHPQGYVCNNPAAMPAVESVIAALHESSPIDTTIGEIADAWGTDPQDLGLLGNMEYTALRETPARFAPTSGNRWDLHVLAPDGIWFTVDGGVLFSDVWALLKARRES